MCLMTTGLITHVWAKARGVVDEPECMDPCKTFCSSSAWRSSSLCFLFACLVFARHACDSS